MIITPLIPRHKNDPELIPIQMIVQTRMDIIKVYLRVLRYLGSVGAFGEDLIWTDDKDTKLNIQKVGDDHYGDVNYLPIFVIDIGGYRIEDKYFMNSAVDSSRGQGTSFVSDMEPGINITVRGRDDIETYRLADTLADYLRILKPDILGAVKNLEIMGGISVGKATPSNDSSGNPYCWECSVSFGVRATKYYNTKRYTGPGSSPDPGVNKGVHIGPAGIQSRLNPEGSVPLFSFANFVISAGEDDESTFIVSDQIVYSGEREAEHIPELTGAGLIFSSTDIDFGDVADPGPVVSKTLVIKARARGLQTVYIEIPTDFDIDVPGYKEAFGNNEVELKLRG